MIKAAQRAKPKVKRQGEADGAADAEKQKVKRRRPTQKKREADEAESEAGMLLSTEHIVHMPYDGVDLLESPARLHEAQTVYLDQMYERAPRELPPDAPTIRSLTMTEIQSDLRRIQQAMNKFENRLTTARAADPPSADDSEDDLAGMPYGNMLRDRRIARENGVVAPEEVVETVPAARRAVKITERELKALKRERDDLERDFMRLRSTYVWQVAEMKRMQKQQDQVMRALSREVIRKAKSLESSRRRTSALQDIMTELESRGNTIKRLTREKDRLESLLEKHEIELPEIDEVYIGDRVKCAPFGYGKVAALNPDTRIITVDLEFGARGYIHEDDVEMLPSDITYLEVEEQLKLRLFEKVGALVRPNGKFSMLGTQSLSRSRVRIDSDDDFDDDDNSEDESMEDEDETSEDDGDNAQNEDDDSMAGKPKRCESNAQDDVISQLKKKRKLIMNTPSSSGGSKKKTKQQQKVINFPATTLPITPYENGLLVSPLSTLPERVAAAGPNALQWLPSYLPKNMNEWEQERYQSLQMKGEIERLRFQLQKAEAEKLDAQQHASDQVESINQLVVQLEKLRESNGASSSASQASPPEASNADHTCPNCGEGTTSVRKNSSASNKSGKSADGAATPAPRANTRKGAASKRASDSGGEEEDDSAEKEKKSSAGDDGGDDESKSKSQDEDEDDGESSDAATSKARATRSLRPRRSKRS